MNNHNTMKTLYFLDSDFDRKTIDEYNFENSDIIAFDYLTHKFLNKKNIPHSIIDDHIKDYERINLFKLCRDYLKTYEKINNSGINFQNIDLVSIVDRNELLEFLMDNLPKILIIENFLNDTNYNKIFLSNLMYQTFHNNKPHSRFQKLHYIKSSSLTFENIQIPLKIANQEIKFSISRKKYKHLKESIEKISSLIFNLKNNKTKNKVILLEFDPEIYSHLLNEINSSGLQPVLINFRKSSMYSLTALKFLKQSNSLVITPKVFLEKNDLELISKTKLSIQKILIDKLENKKLFLNLISMETNFDLLIQTKIINIILQRLEEYILQILISEKIKNMDDVTSIITLNFSGETEKIFSKIQDKIPVVLLQHAFANYLESISYFDMLDDYHNIKNKIAVWGDVVKDYLINVKKIDESKILVTGSPKYDFYEQKNEQKNEQKIDKKIILVTLRPIISHMEGPRIDLFNRYENTLQKIQQIINNHDKIEIIFKLHPQQNPSNEIIKKMITTTNNISFFHHEPIKELLQNCDLHVNIAPDNFDASSVIVEAMLLRKPTLNIQLQSNTFEFEFIKDNSIKLINYNDDVVQEILNLLNENNSLELIKNSQKHLSKYMKHRNESSYTLIDAITKF